MAGRAQMPYVRIDLRSASGERRCRWVMAAVLALIVPATAWAQDPTPDTPAPQSSTSGDTGSVSRLPLPPVTFGAFVDLAEGYSTNAQGLGGSGDDSFTRGLIGASLHYDKPRLQADATYTLTGEYWARYHRLNNLSHHLNLWSRTTLIPEMLFVNASAFASPADLTRIGAISANGLPISRYNSRDSYGYSVTPQFMLRFKDYVTSQLVASQSGVFFVRPSTDITGVPPPVDAAQNALSTTISEQLSSGTWFGRLNWSLVGSYTQSSQSVRTQRQTEGLGNLTYAVTRQFRVFATGGYSDYKSTVPLSKDLSGPTALGGFTWTQGPSLEFTFEAGTQHNFPTYMGSAHWEISPLTQFIASATDTISTPQGDILSRLGSMTAVGGQFGNIGTGLGSDPIGGYTPTGSNGLALDNSINRNRSIDASLFHTDDRMRYTLSAFASERDRLDMTPLAPVKPRSSVYGLRGTVSRTLNVKLDVQLSVGYSVGNEFGGRDRIVSTDAQVNYHLAEKIDLYLTNSLIHRISSHLVGVSNEPLTEDQVIIGIRARL